MHGHAGVRRLTLIALLLAAPVSARQHHAPPPPPPPQQQPPPPPVVALPYLISPPAAGLTPAVPFTPIGAPPPVDLFRVDANNPAPHHPIRPFGPGFGAYAFPGSMDEETRPAPPPGQSRLSPGVLHLYVTPRTARVFVDATDAGTVDRIITEGGLSLWPGPHQIEIRAPDYAPLTFDVRMTSGGSLDYRGALEPLGFTPAIVSRMPPPARATRMYVIPNCYLGNVPPRADRLPDGCRITQLRVVGDQ
jgi:hypothetical protein